MSKLLRAGLLAGLVLTSVASAGRAADQKAIDRAIERGVKALRAMQGEDGTWPHREIGATALAGLTLLECGTREDGRDVRRAAEAVRKASVDLTHNYSICLAILFLDRLGDDNDIPLIESLGVRLLAAQTRTGGWNYNCPAVPDAEVRRLQAHLAARRGPAGRRREGAVQRTVRDLSPAIQQQLGMLNRGSNLLLEMGSDNSNTQFATLALWIARRYGLPVENALERVERRFRTSQHADGGWGYFDPTMHSSGPLARSTASMTCAGLLGLAVADGKDSRNAGERRHGGKAGRDINKDSHLRKGLAALGTALGRPLDKKDGRAALVPRVGGRTYYFLWSLERVAVALDLKTIGKKDWYAWGADILVSNQQDDGSWRGSYAECGADTCFALLFLKRANLVKDLTTQLAGRVEDPGERVLKAGGPREGTALEKPLAIGSGIESKDAGRRDDGRYPEGIARSGESRPVGKPLPEPASSDKPRTDSKPVEKSLNTPGGRMGEDLAKSTGSRFNLLLKTYRTGKGAEFTEALAVAIPKLNGDRQEKARQALVERLTRMKDTTLSEYLADEQPEIRRAAALACAAKGSKTLIPRLIPLVRDTRGGVAEATHEALKQLSGEDFGPKSNADREERLQAARRWLDWWKKQEGK